MERKLREHYQTFINDILTDCNIPQSVASIPINLLEPIYGSEDMEFQQYVAPGVVMT